MIIEGIHLDPEFNAKMLKKYKEQCLCYVITLKDSNEHIRRSKCRNDRYTLNPHKNKYINNFVYINDIERYMADESEKYNEEEDKIEDEEQRNYITIIDNDAIGISMNSLNEAF